MGKKSLLKSTSKKKNAKAKADSDKETKTTKKATTEKAEAKKTKAKAAPKKTKAKAAPKKTKAKAAPKKTKAKAAPKKTAAKAKTTKKPAKKTTKKKALTVKELLMKKFDRAVPDTLFTVEADESARAKITAPPFFASDDPAEIKRIKTILMKKFDLSAPAEAPAPAAEPVSIAELLKKKFNVVAPAKLYTPPAPEKIDVQSPPFVSGLGAEETERVRKLLFKTIDLSAPEPAPAEAPAPAEPEPVPEPEAPPVPIAELLKKKFDAAAPSKLYTPPAAEKIDVQAPPFVSGLDADETERVRKLLFKAFDLSAPEPAPAEAPAPAEPEPVSVPEAPPVPIEELLKKKFDVVAQARLYTPPAPEKMDVQAPPFVSGLDADETERVRKLLFKTFDLNEPEPAAAPVEEPLAEEKAPEPETEAAPVEEAAAEEKAPEPKTEAAPVEEAVAEEKAPEPEAAVPAEEPVAEEVAPEPEKKEAPVKKPMVQPAAGMDWKPIPPVKVPEQYAKVPTAADQASVTPQPKKGLDPMIKTAISAGACLAVIFLVITFASFSNMSSYYLTSTSDAVEVWQGKFAPMGTERIAVLTGSEMPENPKEVYTRAEAGALIVANSIVWTDDLMTAPGLPDFETIRATLVKALPFANAGDGREEIELRLNRIDTLALLYKADISASKGTPEALETAKGYLEEAAALAVAGVESEMIQQKLTAIAGQLGAAQAPVEESLPTPPPVVQ